MEQAFWGSGRERRRQLCPGQNLEVLNLVFGYGTATELRTLRERVWD